MYEPNGMNNSIVTNNILWEFGSSTKVILLSNNGIIDKGLSKLSLVRQGVALKSLQVTRDLRSSVFTRDNVILEDISGGSTSWYSIKGRVGGCKDSEWTRATQCIGKASSSNGTNKLIKVVISLDIILFMAKSNTFRSPYNSWTLKSLESLYNVGIKGRRWSSGKGYKRKK